MKIAVDTRRIGENQPGSFGFFLWEILNRVVKVNPGHEFLFFCSKTEKGNLPFDKNVTALVTGPSPNHPLLLKLWYDLKLPGLLKKHKVDIFVSVDGICSLTTPIPQCVILSDLAFVVFPSFFKKSDLYFLKRYTKKFLQKAKSIVAVSEFLKKTVISNYAIEENKIAVVIAPAGNFYPLTGIEKEDIKRKYVSGKNFFIYTGPIEERKNLINLLKAFSIFKKRQKSDWKLVMAGSIAVSYKKFTASLGTYKHRDDVVVTGPMENSDIARVTGSAYALVFPSLWEGSGVGLLAAMKSQVPVITSANSAMEEIGGDAVLYVNPADHKDIAEKMMLLYKDESLRSQLIEKGKKVAEQYSCENAADIFWQAILKTLG